MGRLECSNKIEAYEGLVLGESHKYTPKEIDRLAAASGFVSEHSFHDEKHYMVGSLILFEYFVKKEDSRDGPNAKQESRRAQQLGVQPCRPFHITILFHSLYYQSCATIHMLLWPKISNTNRRKQKQNLK